MHELNAKIFNRVNKIKHKDAEELIDELNGYEYLNVQKDIEGIFNSLSEIKNTNIEVIKSTLIDILDKNQMYLSYSEINDKKHKISNEIKKLNNLFYKK